MGEGEVFSGAVPVFFPCRNEDDIPETNGYLFFIRGDNTLAPGNNEYLFGGVGVEFVPNSAGEVYLSQMEIFA